jgi:DNA-binding CsgD family transcriptional regulator
MTANGWRGPGCRRGCVDRTFVRLVLFRPLADMLPLMGRGRPPHPDLLTPREWEVLSLIREGLTNPQIAQRLGVTESAAKFHVSEILTKLGVDSRQQAAAWHAKRWRQWSLAPLLVVAGAVERLRLKMFLKVAGGSALAVVGGGFLLLAVGVAASSLRAAADPPSTQEARDLPKLPYERGIMFIQEPLAQYDVTTTLASRHGTPSALLAMLPTVQDAQSLANQITCNTTTIVIDKTTFQSLDPGFLRAQLRAGISFIGLNVPIAELAAATGFEDYLYVEAPNAAKRRESPAAYSHRQMFTQSVPAEPFFGTLSVSPPNAQYGRSGMAQKDFASYTYPGDLKKHLSGVNSDIVGTCQ